MKIINTFDDYIGNEDVKAMLREAIASAKSRNEPLDHVFISGFSGAGKSTLAKVIANEMGVEFEEILCSGKNIGKLNIKLMKMKDFSILLMDEIHNLVTDQAEGLYKFFDQGQVQFNFPGKAPILLDAKKITLIGATTEISKIATPFYNRFPIQIRLENYTSDELDTIVINNVISENLNLTHDAITVISRASKGVPRDSQNLIRRVRDHIKMHYSNYNEISEQIVIDALALNGIDEHGLNTIDRAYITTLFEVFNGEKTGVESIALQLQVEKEVLIRTVEPHLLRAGYIFKSSNGRALDEKGFQLAMEYSANK